MNANVLQEEVGVQVSQRKSLRGENSQVRGLKAKSPPDLTKLTEHLRSNLQRDGE